MQEEFHYCYLEQDNLRNLRHFVSRTESSPRTPLKCFLRVLLYFSSPMVLLRASWTQKLHHSVIICYCWRAISEEVLSSVDANKAESLTGNFEFLMRLLLAGMAHHICLHEVWWLRELVNMKLPMGMACIWNEWVYVFAFSLGLDRDYVCVSEEFCEW